MGNYIYTEIRSHHSHVSIVVDFKIGANSYAVPNDWRSSDWRSQLLHLYSSIPLNFQLWGDDRPG